MEDLLIYPDRIFMPVLVFTRLNPIQSQNLSDKASCYHWSQGRILNPIVPDKIVTGKFGKQRTFHIRLFHLATVAQMQHNYACEMILV